MLDRLMRRAVFAEADRIVRVDVDRVRRNQRRHAHRVARVVGEHQERRVVRNEAAVQREAVRDRAHAELAHAVVDVVRRPRRSALTSFEPFQIVRFDPARSAEPPISSGSFGPNASSAICEALRDATVGPSACSFVDVRIGVRGEIGRQLAGHAALEFGGEIGMRVAIAARTTRSTRLRARRLSLRRPTRRRCRRESTNGGWFQPSARARRRLRPCRAPRRGSIPCPACSARRSR